MKNTQKNILILPSIAAIGLLLLSGVQYRLLVRFLARPTQSVPLPAGTLARLPLTIGDWQGQDVPVNPDIIRATHTDDHVNRVYLRHAETERVGLFIAYGVQARNLMPHRPEVCYPGNGWTLQDSKTTNLFVSVGLSLPCRIYRFYRSGLDDRYMTVLNYYIVDGQYCPDVSLLQSKAWLGSGAIRHVLQVQINCQGDSFIAPEKATEFVTAFAIDSAAAISRLLPDSPSENPIK